MWAYSPAFCLLYIVQNVVVVRAGVPNPGKLPRFFLNTEANSAGQQGQGQIHCPCTLFGGCSVGIVSTSNSHRVTCNGNSYTLSCENPLMGSVGRFFILQTISHPLDVTKTYPLTDQSVWKCSKDDTVPNPTPGPTPEPVMVGCTECADFNNRIVGGNEVTPDKYPFMVSIMLDTKDVTPSEAEGTDEISDRRYVPLCGGTIINKRNILGVASCLINYQQNVAGIAALGLNLTEAGPPLVVAVGTHDVCDDSSGQRLIPANIDTVHPNYWYTPENPTPHDLWVIKLAEDLVWSDSVKPVCLPQPEMGMDMMGPGYARSERAGGSFTSYYNGATYEDMSSTILGWGTTDKWEIGEPLPSLSTLQCVLKEASLKIMDSEDLVCRAATVGWENQKALTNMCARSDPVGTAGTCFNDKGAPLIVNNDGKALLVGVLSYGAGCASSNGEPDVFTRVSNYLEFIMMSTADGTC